MSEIYLNNEESIRSEHEIISKFLQRSDFVQAIECEYRRSDARKKDAVELVKRLYKSPEESLNSFCIDMGFKNPKGSKIIDQLNSLLSKFSKQHHIFPHIQVFPQSRISKYILCHFACAEKKDKLSNKTYPINIVTLKEAKARGGRESQADLSDLHIEQFRNKLKEEAQVHLKEKLHGKELDDYKSLGLEIGLLAESRQERNDLYPDPTTHNRVWQECDHKELEDPKGIYILSSEMGCGKTTFLRNLQLEIIENTELIPIFLEASEIDLLNFMKWDTDSFLLSVGKLINRALNNLNDDFLITQKDKIVFLIDGLDQIAGSGTEYNNLIDKLMGVIEDKLIITSRPFAVIDKEKDSRIRFLRLKPFGEKDTQAYFGEKYIRAGELCKTCPEMIRTPMLAYMVRCLIEEGEDRDVKNRTGLFEKFIHGVFEEYTHENLKVSVDKKAKIREAYREISFKAIANDVPYLQRIPLSFAIGCKETEIEIDDLFEYGIAYTIINRAQANEMFIYYSHQSFQEYLAAEYIAQNYSRIQQVLSEKWNPKWKEVIKFVVGMEGQEIITKILSEKDNPIHSKLLFASEMVSETDVQMTLKNHIFERLDALSENPVFSDAIYFEKLFESLNHIKACGRILFKLEGEDKKLVTWSRRIVEVCKEGTICACQASIGPL